MKLSSQKIKESEPQAREDLQELERYIKELSIFLPLPFCIVNPLGVILNANQAFYEMTEWNEFEIVGEEIDCLFLDGKEAGRLKAKVAETGLVKNYEMLLITKSKKKIDASVSISARKDKDENLIGYFLAFFDVSELKKFQRGLEQKVAESTGQVREKLEELEKFNRLAVGRELKMIELKEEVERLKKELKNAG